MSGKEIRLGAYHERLSVAIVCTQPLWHGGEQQAALLAEGLRARGHQCRVLARRASRFAQGMTQRGFAVVEFSGRGRTPLAIWRIRRTLANWRPNVLYYNDPHAITSAGLATLGLNTPARIAARRVDFPVKSATRYHNFCDQVVCVSHAVRDVCVGSGLEPALLSVVHDGVDPQQMRNGQRQRGRAVCEVNDGQDLLLTVARLTGHKGHRYFLEAMPAVLAKRPQAVWAIAGDGPLRGELEAQTRQLGLERSVRFLGHRDDVPDLLAAADRLIVPSHLEGLCSSIADAMFNHVPVVATRAGGIPDLLDARGSASSPVGWLVPPKDPAALAEAVLTSLRFPNLTRQRACEAFLRAGAEFSADVMVDRTLEVFRRVLSVQRSRSLAA